MPNGSPEIITDVAPGTTGRTLYPIDTNGIMHTHFVFATLRDGRIFFNDYSLEGPLGIWREPNGDGRTNAAPAVSLVASQDYMFIAVKGLDGSIYLNQGDPFGPFVGWRTSHDFQTDVAPALIANGDWTYLFAKHPDGRIFYTSWVLGSGGTGWREVNGGGRTDATPVASVVDDYWFIAIKGLDGSINLNQGDVGGSVGWRTSHDFQTDVAPALASLASPTLKRTYLFAKHLDGRIFYNWWDLGSGGTGWREVDGFGRTDAAPSATGFNDRVVVTIKGLDGHLYRNMSSPDATTFNNWIRIS